VTGYRMTCEWIPEFKEFSRTFGCGAPTNCAMGDGKTMHPVCDRHWSEAGKRFRGERPRVRPS